VIGRASDDQVQTGTTVNRKTNAVEIHAAANETLANTTHEIATQDVDPGSDRETMTDV